MVDFFAAAGGSGLGRIIIVALLLAGLWFALRRTALDGRARAVTFLAVAVPLLLWLALVWQMAFAGLFEVGRMSVPLVPFAIFVPLIVAVPLLMRSNNIAAAIDAAQPSWLVGLQVYRLVGATFLASYALGTIPGAFALPAGTGDTVVGLLALPVAFALAKEMPGARPMAVAWNLCGIADLTIAFTMGTLTSRFPHLLGLDQANLQVGLYPTALIPAFAVPLSLILHVLSLWQLWRRRGGLAMVR